MRRKRKGDEGKQQCCYLLDAEESRELLDFVEQQIALLDYFLILNMTLGLFCSFNNSVGFVDFGLHFPCSDEFRQLLTRGSSCQL